MTKEKLFEHYSLRQELAKSRETLQSLQEMNDTACGLPEFFALEKNALISSIEARERKIAEQQKEVEAFIAGIEPITVRLIFRLRFIHALQWKEVAYMMGGTYSAQSVTNAFKLYMKKTESEEKAADGDTSAT